MNLYKKNLKKLTNANAYYPSLEHDACGVGLVASIEGKKTRKIVEFGIQALKAVWHRVLWMLTAKLETEQEFISKFQQIFLKKGLKIMADNIAVE